MLRPDGVYTPESLRDMRAGLRVGSVALIGGIYYTRTALNHSLYPGTACGTYKNKTFTLDVYPWLSAALDGMLLCAPGPPNSSCPVRLLLARDAKPAGCIVSSACAESSAVRVAQVLPEQQGGHGPLRPTAHRWQLQLRRAARAVARSVNATL